MKTIPTIATAILAIFLVLAPAVAFGAAVTVKTDSASYTGTTSIHVSGQVTPPPTTNTAVTLTTMNPSKQVVDIGTPESAKSTARTHTPWYLAAQPLGSRAHTQSMP